MVPAISQHFRQRWGPHPRTGPVLNDARLYAVALRTYIKSTVMFLAFAHPSFPVTRPQEIGALSVAGHPSLQTLQHDTRNLHRGGHRTWS